MPYAPLSVAEEGPRGVALVIGTGAGGAKQVMQAEEEERATNYFIRQGDTAGRSKSASRWSTTTRT